MPIDRFYVILNPASGRGTAPRAWKRAQAVFERAGTEYEVVRTASPRHAESLAAGAVRAGWPAVVAVGGDGTIQEVANGLLLESGAAPTIPLGIIPAGSGNDFSKLLPIPKHDPGASARGLLRAEPRRVDVGRIGARYFTNGVGVGLDARVAMATRSVRWLRGHAMYTWALLQVLRSHHTPHIQLVIDGVEVLDGRVTLVGVGNGGCIGGGFWICPDARPDDGRLDICVADALDVRRILGFVPRVMRGTHVHRPGVHTFRGRRVRISSVEPLPVQADGEILAEAANQIEIELLPGRLSVLA